MNEFRINENSFDSSLFASAQLSPVNAVDLIEYEFLKWKLKFSNENNNKKRGKINRQCFGSSCFRSKVWAHRVHRACLPDFFCLTENSQLTTENIQYSLVDPKSTNGEHFPFSLNFYFFYWKICCCRCCCSCSWELAATTHKHTYFLLITLYDTDSSINKIHVIFWSTHHTSGIM